MLEFHFCSVHFKRIITAHDLLLSPSVLTTLHSVSPVIPLLSFSEHVLFSNSYVYRRYRKVIHGAKQKLIIFYIYHAPLCCRLLESMATRWGCLGTGNISWDFFLAVKENLPSADHEVSRLSFYICSRTSLFRRFIKA